MRTLLSQIKAHSVVLVNAGSLVGATAVTAGLGFVYWWLAARLFAPEAVGIASALFSAMMLLGTVCTLGLGTLLMGELPRHPGRKLSLINGALLLVGGVGGCAGILFAIVAPKVAINFHIIQGDVGDIALFALGISLTAITLVLDQALLGLLRGDMQLWRNTLFAVAKLAALFVVGLWLSHHAVGMTIYATWMIGNVLSIVLLAGFAVLKGGWPGRTYLPQWVLLRELKASALQHHLLNLALMAPVLSLPVLVTALLSARMNAWFYISYMITSVLFVLPFALTIALYASDSSQPGMLRGRIRLTLTLAFVTALLANCVLLLGAKQILSVFGHVYADQATWTLRILGLSAFPVIIKDHYIALCRIKRRLMNAASLITAAAILELSAVVLGAHFGSLSGLSLGWVIAVSIEAVVMFPTVFRAARLIDASTQ